MSAVAIDDISYYRDIHTNYIVLFPQIRDYRLRMLEENRIGGLLSASLRDNGFESKIYYDISGKECLKTVMDIRPLSLRDIRAIVGSVIDAIENLEIYLLDPGDLILTPELIYVNPLSMEGQLCCLPGYEGNCMLGLSILMQELEKAADPKDAAGLALAKELRRTAQKENCLLSDLTAALVQDPDPESEERKDVVMEDLMVADALPDFEDGFGEPRKKQGFFASFHLFG